MKIDKLNILISKSKDKGNGIYSYDGTIYRVKDSSLLGYREFNKIYSLHGNFVIEIATVNSEKEAKSILRGL